MTTLHSPLVRFTNTIVSSSGKDTDVIAGEWQVTALTAYFTIDASLFGKGYLFDINFQIRGVDGRLTNNWFGNRPLDEIKGWGGIYYVNQARYLGIRSNAGQAESRGAALHVFRPILFVDSCKYSASLYQPNGLSQFAIGDEHYLWCE